MPTIAKGLDGVIVDVTSVSEVTPETSSLTYRGYRAQDLADQCSFDEVAYLLWNAELPSASQLKDFSSEAKSLRQIDPTLIKAIESFPKTGHPMDMVRTGVSWLGMEEKKIRCTWTCLARSRRR